MTIVALGAAGEGWWTGDGEPAGATAEFIRYGILANARDPFDPTEKAFRAPGSDTFAASTPYRGLSLKREYGLRPGLLAVTNLWEWEDDGSQVAATKGAPEAIAGLSGLSHDDHARLAGKVNEMARQGMRVFGVAIAELPRDMAMPETPRDLSFCFIGLVGLADPLRPTVPAAVRECRSASMRVVMITGDYMETRRGRSRNKLD